MEVSCFSLLFSPDVWWSNSSEMLLHFSFWWKQDWQSRSICSSNSQGVLLFRFAARRKSSSRTEQGKTLGWGLSLALAGRTLMGEIWEEEFRASGCALTFPAFIHQHVWHPIPLKPRSMMKSLAVSLCTTGLGGIWKISMNNLWQTCTFFLNYGKVLQKVHLY